MLDHRNIKRLAAREGFDLCGIAPCRHLAENEARFREWLAAGYQSSLDYLERNADKRFDPRRLVERARTAVVCAVAYKNRASEGYPPGCRTASPPMPARRITTRRSATASAGCSPR